MKRDFWSGNHPLGHVTLLASLFEDFWMTASPVLYAKGYSKVDGETPVYLWGLGNYKYEIESRPLGTRITKSEVFESSYEDAMEKFEDLIDWYGGIRFGTKGVLMWCDELTWEDY